MSITSLAESSGVSEATITRFCRGLGLYGYNDFKLALAKSERLNELGDPPDSPQSVNSEDDFDTLCIVCYGKTIAAPCGICRQVLSELLNQDTPIVLANQENSMVTTIAELLPMQFTSEDMK